MFDYHIDNMDKFIKIPGLQHISEDILKLLDKNILIQCRLVNSSWKTVLEQPRFWLKKFKLEKLPLDGQESLKALVKKLKDDQMAKNSANDLLEYFNLENKLSGLAQRLRNDELLKEFVLLMIKIYKGKENNLLKIAVRLKGGYTDPITPNELRISRYSLKDTNKYQELIKFIIEHDNLNNKFNLVVSVTESHGTIVGDATTIHLAALFGFTEVLQKLNNKRHTPLDGWTGIGNYKHGCLCCFELAAMGGHLDTMKYLVSITDISIASNHESIQKCSPWCSPLNEAVSMGHLDIVKYLVATLPTPVLFLRNNYYSLPQRSNRERIILSARQGGHFEVAKFLEGAFSD